MSPGEFEGLDLERENERLHEENEQLKNKLCEIGELRTTISQLLNLANGIIWDGNLISKSSRDTLVKNKLVKKCEGGWNVITSKGVKYLHRLGFIEP